MTHLKRSLLSSLFITCMAACGGPEAYIEDGAGAEADAADAVVASCELGASCPASFTLLNAKPVRQSPPGSAAAYWVPGGQRNGEIPAAGVTPTVVGTAILSGLMLNRTDLSVWLSSTADGTGALSADDFLLVEVRNSRSVVINRLVMSGYELRLADRVTAVQMPGGLSNWNNASGGFSSAPIDLAPFLPTGQRFSVRVSVLDNGGATSNSKVTLTVASKVAPHVDDLFDAQARQALVRPVLSALSPLFTPGTTTATLGGAVVAHRQRTCAAVSGCTAWLYSAHQLPARMNAAAGPADLPVTVELRGADPSDPNDTRGVFPLGTLYLNQSSVIAGGNHTIGQSNCTDVSNMRCWYYPQANVFISKAELWSVATHKLWSGNGETIEYEQAVYVRFAATEHPVLSSAGRVTW